MMEDTEQRVTVSPSKEVITRIDLGLLTGAIAAWIALLALFATYKQIQMAKDTQKAAVMPIVQVDMGYQYKESPYTFEVKLSNVGVGIAYVQRVRALINDESIQDYTVLQDAVMNGRMRGNAVLLETNAAGYLPAGESITPWVYNWGKSVNGRSEIEAYLRGQFGAPMDGVAIEICYCSLLDDCWVTNTDNTAKPTSVKSCGKDNAQDDFFARAISARAAKKLQKD